MATALTGAHLAQPTAATRTRSRESRTEAAAPLTPTAPISDPPNHAAAPRSCRDRTSVLRDDMKSFEIVSAWWMPNGCPGRVATPGLDATTRAQVVVMHGFTIANGSKPATGRCDESYSDRTKFDLDLPDSIDCTRWSVRHAGLSAVSGGGGVVEVPDRGVAVRGATSLVAHPENRRQAFREDPGLRLHRDQRPLRGWRTTGAAWLSTPRRSRRQHQVARHHRGDRPVAVDTTAGASTALTGCRRRAPG